MKNYYEILGANPTDDIEVIKKKTAKKAKLIKKNSDEYFEMREAYYVLTSYFKRKEYDNLFFNKSLNLLSNNNMNQDLFNNLENLFNPFPNIKYNSKNTNFKSYSYSSVMKPTKDGIYEKKEHWITNDNNKKKEHNKTSYFNKKGYLLNNK